jgi:peptidoglycan-associated lipoprotein
MNRPRVTQVLAVVFVALALYGCGKKRPPAVSTGGQAPSASSHYPRESEPVPSGPDIRSVEPEGTAGRDLGESEGGPLADIHFEYDQAALTDEGRGILEKHALWLQAHRDAKVTLEGHCDERGTVEYNLALGDRRAQNAREYLVHLGVAANRLGAISFGKEKPLDMGHDEAAWARNRRVHFRVSS